MVWKYGIFILRDMETSWSVEYIIIMEAIKNYVFSIFLYL